MDINRKTAFQTLLEIEKNGAYSNLELNHRIKLLKPDSPAFVRELVYGVTEQKLYLDYLLQSLIPKGLKGVKKQVLTLLRMGLYQIIFMDSVPEYAAVGETVKLARKVAVGREGFVNGVLRGYCKKRDQIKLPDRCRDTAAYLSVRYSCGQDIVRLWLSQYGEEKTEKLLAAANRTPKLSVRVNLLKTSREELSEKLRAEGFETEEGTLSQRILFVQGSGLLETESYRKGLFSVQDQASCLTAEKLAPNPGDTVLDICAAPGGKSLAMAEIMENKGRIRAFDIYEHKLALLNREAERLGLSVIETETNDGTKERTDLLASADCVLVDGPCSGLGVIRRKPEIKYREISDEGRSFAEKQLQILETSAVYVKKGGRLLYSTCTINATENSRVAEKFLAEHKEFIREEQIQLLPDESETDGFFICTMRKADC